MYEKILAENSVLLGHTNHNQKIKYVLSLKRQINDLMEENRNLIAHAREDSLMQVALNSSRRASTS